MNTYVTLTWVTNQDNKPWTCIVQGYAMKTFDSLPLFPMPCDLPREESGHVFPQ